MNKLILAAVLTGGVMLSGSVAAVAQDAATTLTVRESPEHGNYIAGGEGMSLYMFEADTQGQGEAAAETTCYDDCAEAWPPLIGEEPQAGEGVQADLIDTIERRDGQMQVTYNGWPLYYFVRDQNPGDTTGHDVEGFGAEWYLVAPDGEVVGH